MLNAFMAFLVAAAIAPIDFKNKAHAQRKDCQTPVSFKRQVKVKKALAVRCFGFLCFCTSQGKLFPRTKGATPPR